MSDTLMVTGNHGLTTGDLLEIISPDRRWWKRAWCWCLRREPPVLRRRLVVRQVQATTLSVSEWAGAEPGEMELAALLEPWPPERRWRAPPKGRDQINAEFGDLND